MEERHIPAGGRPRQVPGDPRQRALLLWPGLDRMKLARTRGEPRRVASLVGRRSALPRETILRMLGCDPGSSDDQPEQEAVALAGAAPDTSPGRPVFSPVH